jgi:UDP-N-acetylmuramoyl-tripeptide--D-alanyl-D-alanine ligase
MTALWTGEAFADAAGGRMQGRAPDAITGISIDSRTVGAGEAFVAIRGDRFDGHDYVAAAMAAGAGLALVSEGRGPTGREPLVVVEDDPLDALQRIGRAARARTDARIVAVTGSVGKTGTKEMLRAAFSGLGTTHAPVGSFNNHWGVPLTLARMPAETAYGVFEIGMNHAGEIRPLVRMVRPHVAIITNVEAVHLEFFESEAGIADAKAEILEGLEPGGVAILNRDNRWFDRLAGRARELGVATLSFGAHAEADVRLGRVTLDANGSEVEAAIAGRSVPYRLGAPGRHLVQNSLAVVAVAHAIGADLTGVLPALGAFRAPKGRGERHELAHPRGPFTLIDESYNANPASMRAALALLGQAQPGPGGRRIAVLGDMRELGETSAEQHRELAGSVVESGADLVFLAGPDMQALWQDLPDVRRGAYAETAGSLESVLVEAVGPGDVVMIKASLGTRLGPVVEALKQQFPAEPK